MSRERQSGHGDEVGSVTMKDVAREAGVGIGTVSRVLNRTPGVSDKMRIRVENSISRLGFKANPIAQSMRNGQTRMFACVVRDFSVPVLSNFVNAMQAAVDLKGYGLQVASSYHDAEREVDIVQRLALRRADGIVIATSSEDNAIVVETLEELDMPVVLLDRDTPARLDAVLIDHRFGIRSAVESLLDLGHRRIVMISGEEGLRPTRERIAGLEDAYRGRGIDVPPGTLRMGAFTADYAYSELSQLLRRPDRPTAIIAGGTGMLAGALQAIRNVGLRIPEDISLVSGADSELSQLHMPGITSIRWEHDKLGAAAGKMLMDRIDNPKLPAKRICYPTELVGRGSCAAPPD